MCVHTWQWIMFFNRNAIYIAKVIADRGLSYVDMDVVDLTIRRPEKCSAADNQT